MVKKEVEIKNRFGIHARPASLFVKEVVKHESQVLVEKDGLIVNGNSIVDLLVLQADYKSKIIISAEGPDEKETLADLIKLIDSLEDDKYLA